MSQLTDPEKLPDLIKRFPERDFFFGDTGKNTALGMAKSHDIIYYFHPGDWKKAGSATLCSSFERRLLALPPPQWICGSLVAGHIHPYDPEQFADVEQALRRMFDNNLNLIQTYHWYGFTRFGVVLSGHSDIGHVMKHLSQMPDFDPGKYVGWYNQENGREEGPWLMYLRSGDRTYFDFAEAETRYLMDVATLHYNPDRQDKVGYCHRHDRYPWGGGLTIDHSFNHGYIWYYYLTGDRRGFEVAKLMADQILRLQCPNTGWINEPDSSGAALGELCDVYDATGDIRYLEAAKALIGAIMSDPFPNLMKKNRMSGYVDRGMIRYLILTADPRLATYILRYTDYMIDNHTGSFGPHLNIYAYAYYFKPDQKYLQAILRGLEANTRDPDAFGIYLHNWYFMLYRTPYALEALSQAPKDMLDALGHGPPIKGPQPGKAKK